MDIKGKVAIVTGASMGIGKAAAFLLSQKGAAVVLASRSKDKLENLSEKLKNSFVVETDMRDEKQIKRLVEKTVKKFGRVDILINNAGRGYDASVEKIDIKMFKELIQLDFLGPLIAMQEVIPYMRKNHEGSIINISSGTSLMNIPRIGAYSSLKKALVGLSLTAREELFRDNISVSVVYPYITDTNFHKNIMGPPRHKLPTENNEKLSPTDSPEIVAEKIIEAIATGKPEVYVHDWMGKPRT